MSGPLTVPDTGGWQNWLTIPATLQLNAGVQTARLVVDTDGANAAGNFDRIQFSAGSSAPGPSAGGGSTISVGPGGDLQAAIDAARPGDTILLQPGAVYEGGLMLPAKGGSDYITIRSAAPDASLPPDGVRITPDYAPLLPKIQGGAAGLPAIMTDLGAHHWRLQFLELIDYLALRRHPHPWRRFLGTELAVGRRARPDRRSRLRARRPRPGTEARDRAQLGVHYDQGLLHLGHPPDEWRLAGHCRMERTRSVHHHEQLPRGHGRGLPARRVRPSDQPASSRRTSCSRATRYPSSHPGETWATR